MISTGLDGLLREIVEGQVFRMQSGGSGLVFSMGEILQYVRDRSSAGLHHGVSVPYCGHTAGQYSLISNAII